MRKPKAKTKRVFRAPAPKKAPQVHQPEKGKGSYRRRARTEKREQDPPWNQSGS